MAGAIEIEDYRDLAGATASESDGNMTREQVLSLMKQKDEYEAELAAMAEVLKTQGCGMDEELVDADGFPRADIDVYQVRHARHGIRTKGNDLKALMGRIEQGLYSLHAQARESAPGGVVLSSPKPTPTVAPFARVLVVVEGGPAEGAGIRQGDLVAKFGTVTKENFTGLKNISDVAAASKDRAVEMTVIRGQGSLRLRLTPNDGWGGQGLLGFKIRPLTSGESSPDR